MANVPSRVVQLIETFDRNIEAYKKQPYNETQVRREFIDPFFEALGWDVANKQGYAPAYRDVIHEDAIKVGGATEAPDYCFRIGEFRKFFVEAKKPSVDIKDDVHPAYKLRRYAWSAKLPLSILTDFEEFAIYDCRMRPKQADRASTARIQYLTYKDYIEKWDEIANIFSKDAVLKGSFDKFTTEAKGKRGTTTVDIEFLTELEKWRRELARVIALKNRKLSVQEINFAVQRTIDRILFLRMCEDRGIEHYGQLLGLSTGRETYQRLCQVFRQADAKYNSGLFHFRPEKGRPEPDELTPNITIDDTPLKWILHNLYYPQCPYVFHVLPPEILGNVYEQFLGKVIRLTPAHQAKIEEKPEVKKAGGVYYTPDYIVNYIVKNTVGKLCENKTPKQISDLKILDPACGSGSFLLGAYTYLLNYHRDWYVENGPEKHTKKIYQGRGGQWFLTIAEKKKILLYNIFGVDIDSQAVEVTKLSLLLKALEGESAETVGQTYKMFHERALPDLGYNIKCGNSLIGPDFYENKDPGSIDPEEYRRINPFDWKAEFPQMFSGKNPGFDVVMGNPPYVDSEWMTQYFPNERNYCVPRYRSASGNWDIFCVFIEKSLDLCKLSGYSSMIVPNKLGSVPYASAVRSILTVDNQLVSLRDYSRVPVFPVSVYPIVYVSQRVSPKPVSTVYYERMQLSATCQIVCSESHDLEYSRYFSQPDQPWQIFSVIAGSNPAERLRASLPSLSTIAEVLGAATVSEAYEIKPLIKEYSTGTHANLMMINSGTIDRYHFLWGEKAFRYIKDSYLRPVIPVDLEKKLPSKRREQAKLPKIIVAGMTKELECAIDLEGAFLAGKSTCIIFSSINLKFLLGLLNSKLLSFYYRTIFGGSSLAGGYLRIGPPQLRTIPIPSIDHSNRTDRAKHDKMVKLVEQMLDLHKRLAKAKVPAEKTRIQRQINTTDSAIDKLTCELYNLTPEEIAIIEQSS